MAGYLPGVPEFILAGALCTLGIGFFVRTLAYGWHYSSKEERARYQLQYQRLRSQYKTVEKPIAFSEEKPVEIKSLYVYPIKGIRTSPVDSLELGPHGVKYDREMVLISQVTLRPVTSRSDFSMGILS